MRRIWRLAAHFGLLHFLLTCALAKPRELSQHTAADDEEPGFWLTLSYDGSQHRTAAWGFLPSAAISLTEEIQLGAYLNATTGDGLAWRWHESLQAGAWLSYGLGSTGDWDWEVECELSGPSLMSGRGLDTQISLTASGSLGENVFAGCQLGTALNTSPLPEDKVGYLFAAGWIGCRTDLLTHDSLSCGFYAATHESQGYGNLLAIEARYTAKPKNWEAWELTLALGKEVTSPYEHGPYYAGFTLTRSF